MQIRAEAATDARAIARVIERAFADHPHSDHTEPFIVNALRQAGALSISLVAEERERIVGHIAFSPVRIRDGSLRWFGLGPVAVEPALHRRGIGTALIEDGLARLRAAGGNGCVVFGDPTYYRRFGFASIPGLVYPGAPAGYFMALSFCAAVPQGEVAYHDAFAADRDA